ncbi:MAG: 50S ribosomal protein L10 [Patescibacteria group bacterium]
MDSYTITSQNRQKKEVLVEKFLEKVAKAKAIVFTNYTGLTHQQIEGVKKAMKANDAEYVATKNTLLLRALAEKGLSDEDKAKLKQPTGTIFLYNDVVAPLKLLAKTIKELKLPVIKFGVLENTIISDQQVVKLSQIAPLPVLRAQLLGQMKAPISGLHRALNWNLQQLVLTLNAIKDKKA